MTAPKAQSVETSKALSPPVHIDIPSEEGSEETEGESDEGDSEDEETDKDALVEDSEGHRDKGKQVAASTIAQDEEEAAVQPAIAHSLADMVTKALSSTTQPSLGEARSSQAPDPASQQVEVPTPASQQLDLPAPSSQQLDHLAPAVEANTQSEVPPVAASVLDDPTATLDAPAPSSA
ncbi:uncharacterized protein [Nicotiana sylvestris]|uniref:uncharacterized protein n=1 Tax=Nicotiana sylvestris TaxID=4096 RepID=UPI00388C767D